MSSAQNEIGYELLTPFLPTDHIRRLGEIASLRRTTLDKVVDEALGEYLSMPPELQVVGIKVSSEHARQATELKNERGITIAEMFRVAVARKVGG